MRANARRLRPPAAPARQRGLSRSKPRTSGFKSAPVRAQNPQNTPHTRRRLCRILCAHAKADSKRHAGAGASLRGFPVRRRMCGHCFLPSGLPPEKSAVRTQTRRILRLPGTGFAGHCANERRLVGNGTPGQAQACGDSPCGVGCAGIASFRPGCRAEACHSRTLPVPQPVRRRHGRAACVLRCPVKESAGNRKYS